MDEGADTSPYRLTDFNDVAEGDVIMLGMLYEHPPSFSSMMGGCQVACPVLEVSVKKAIVFVTFVHKDRIITDWFYGNTDVEVVPP